MHNGSSFLHLLGTDQPNLAFIASCYNCFDGREGPSAHRHVTARKPSRSGKSFFRSCLVRTARLSVRRSLRIRASHHQPRTTLVHGGALLLRCCSRSCELGAPFSSQFPALVTLPPHPLPAAFLGSVSCDSDSPFRSRQRGQADRRQKKTLDSTSRSNGGAAAVHSVAASSARVDRRNGTGRIVGVLPRRCFALSQPARIGRDGRFALRRRQRKGGRTRRFASPPAVRSRNHARAAKKKKRQWRRQRRHSLGSPRPPCRDPGGGGGGRERRRRT